MIERNDNPWGREIIFARTNRYKGRVLHIINGRELKVKKEDSVRIFFLNRGMVNIEITGSKDVFKIELTPGRAVNFDYGASGRILALSDSELIECSYRR